MRGLEKAAVFLLTVGEELAGQVVKHLQPNEIQKITNTMVKIKDLSREEVDKVAEEFIQVSDSHAIVGMNGGEYIKNLLTKTLGSEKVNELMESIMWHSHEGGLEAIQMMEPRIIADLIKREHPQVIAFIVSTLEPVKASQVLEHLPDFLRGNVIYRISTMEEIQPTVLTELEDAMKTHIADTSSGKGVVVGGIKFAADILNRLNAKVEREILDEVGKIEEGVALRIEEQLFVFEDLMDLDDRTIQAILKEISTDLLVVSLRGVDEKIKDRFFSNMSERAASIVKEEMDMMRPVRVKDVEKAQQDIIKIVKSLEEQGKITVGGKGGEEVFV